MDIADIAAKALKKIATAKGKSLAKKGEAPVIAPAEPVRMKNGTDEFFNAGFACKEVMPADVTAKKYYIAGYRMDHPVTGVNDPLTVRAMWLDVKDNGGIVMVSADIIGLTGFEVNRIRESLSDFTNKTNCKLINISCTHSHASIDTVGYWGRLMPPQSGVDKEYMDQLCAAIKEVCIKAYENRKEGRMYVGSVRVPDAVDTGRASVDDRLTRFRFVPNDGSNETWFLNFGAHPNTMGGDCTEVSADYPYYLREAINKVQPVNVLFSAGPIASININDKLAEDRKERTRLGGELLAKAAFNIDNDELMPAEITVVHQPYYAPIENYVLAFMFILKLCNARAYPNKDSSVGLALLTEMNYIKIGTQKILTLGGETFAENVDGKYFDAANSGTGIGPEVNAKPLREIANDDKLIIFGVTNDMTGYMVPTNNVVLHPTQAYLSSYRDNLDRNHYHETNGLSAEITHVVAKQFEDIIKRTEG